MKRRPIIGISSSVIVDEAGSFAGYKRAYVNKDYVDAVIRAGGVPLIIPFSTDKEVIISQAQLIDGLILSGGHDINPYNYGQEPSQKIGETFPERDTYEMILLEESKKRNIPILGICRGFQLINVAAGGTLYQDLSLIPGNILKHNQVSNPTLKTHKVEIKENSVISSIFGKETMVNSFHHQVIDKVANDFIVVAKASDGVVEAIEHKTYKFLVAVQWHPEMLAVNCEKARELFSKFVEEAKK
ncbi:gamma-glutamyl-gamma-aminobutyrate hydrolase family protein [Fusobacterium animalis]|uniref:Peptidase C26 n=1 Tax=Fusobacterium nucleatum TaxID=851 RepID=A0A133PCN3_FUSNU|nr:MULTISPECIES: gamma-glutamyl-gamma-aminobutyrate hydrolase family protein [Fusobacterium]KXA26261.1 peptidase C26 [Fusobacterium nucleatum]MCL4576457.1 glutamine amidotransferase [Fusobacterium nucleatum YWH7056]MCL4582853.1 glutamine amidotransferase [Fusobacterium nucleatum YWH7054]MCL4591774.1 glutamine amidotransferase [Fusobacterium nucleatum YWH7053]CDA07682.1 anthranilate synthase component II [Fusobacterium sp. CAG:649]